MADIVERLRDCAQCKHSEAWSRIDGGQDLCIGASLAEEAADEIERLRSALRIARTHVVANNSADHMLDGFGPRRRRPSDRDLKIVDEALAYEQKGDGK